MDGAVEDDDEETRASEIVPGRLLLGCADCARLAASRKNPQGVTHLLNVSDSVVVRPPVGMTKSGILTEMVPIRDSGEDNIFEDDAAGIWARCRGFLQNALGSAESESCVLLHCALGVNRSATIVLAWLMETRRWPYAQAFAYVKERRPFIDPVPKHIEQLVAFERRLGRGSVLRAAFTAFAALAKNSSSGGLHGPCTML